MYKRDVVMFDLVSLTVGISIFPFGYCLKGYAESFGQSGLCPLFFFSIFHYIFSNHNFHKDPLFRL